jgi:hypothetical protein
MDRSAKQRSQLSFCIVHCKYACVSLFTFFSFSFIFIIIFFTTYVYSRGGGDGGGGNRQEARWRASRPRSTRRHSTTTTPKPTSPLLLSPPRECKQITTTWPTAKQIPTNPTPNYSHFTIISYIIFI